MDIREMSDKAVMALIGERIQKERLNQNLTQVELAQRAGIGVRTLGSLEAGEKFTIATLIRVMRALGKLAALDGFLPEPGLSPLQLAKLQGRERQRASGRRRNRGSKIEE
ncbi:MAG: helix-turn-helix transcriptional regulator [Verrucomicrobia bacterium]|nr:helix-turn-helix transcriptional regulator [Verrucomicrobiota bacterium]